MKKFLGGVVGVVLLAVVGFVAVVSMQPAQLHVERSLTIEATPADVAGWMSDHKKTDAWSPWNELDPNMKKTYSAKTNEVGSWTAWDGNDEVGAGKQTFKSIAAGKVEQDLHFDRPFESDAVVRTTWSAAPEGTKVTWAMTSQNDFMGKAAGLFMDMDAMLGADFEKGLGMLAPLAEKTRADREAAEKARLDAEAAAAALAANGEGAL